MKQSKKRDCLQKCKCCLVETELKDLWSPNDGECEKYGDMLTECFALPWQEPSDSNSEYICRSCVGRLNDAVKFKKEILYSEQVLLLKIEEEPLENMKQETELENEVTTEYFELEEADIKVEPIENPEVVKRKHKNYTDEDLQKCVEAVVNNKMSQNKASIKFNVSRSAISRALATSIKKPKKSQTEKKSKTYTDEDLEKCLEDVKNGKFTQGKAALFYDIPRTTISRALKRYELSLAKPEILKKIKQYTDEDLKNCLEAIKNNTFSQTKASQSYKIPIKTIRRELARLKSNTKGMTWSLAQTELSKHGDNIASILLNTNATPIKGHNDFGYNCCFCSAAYVNPADLKKHTINHDDEDKKGFIKGKHMRSYVVKLDITELQCDICKKEINSLDDVMTHLQDHGKKIHLDINNHIVPFKFDGPELCCTNCRLIFTSFKTLMEHMNRHSKNYVCDICGSGYVTRITFDLHRASHNKGAFPCKYCSKVFETRPRKLSHELVVHIRSLKLSKCGHCGERFNSRRKKQIHVSEVHGVKIQSVKCQVCGKVLATKSALRIHVKRDHLLERRYVCKLCEMKFFSHAQLKNHMVKHSGVKKYQCDVCKKFYGKLYTLTEHMRIHADDRRFKCEHCNLSFVQKCSWRAHMRTKHGEPV